MAARGQPRGTGPIPPERLQGKTAEDVRWLSEIAAQHNDIVCRGQPLGHAAAAARGPFPCGSLVAKLGRVKRKRSNSSAGWPTARNGP